ncbi:MAG: aspartyl-tRNA synthetase [Bacillus sp. (in: firmicutes)]
MKKWSSGILVLVIIAAIWIISAKSDSYSEPQEALFASDNDLLLIPSYKINDKALFFFIKNTNNLGSAYVQKGLFGWKVDFLSWSPMDIEQNYENLNGYQGHGDNLIYGLIRHGDERIVKIGETDATILDLVAMLPPREIEEFQLDGLSIWYLESDVPLNGEEIRLLNANNGEEIDTIEIME